MIFTNYLSVFTSHMKPIPSVRVRSISISNSSTVCSDPVHRKGRRSRVVENRTYQRLTMTLCRYRLHFKKRTSTK